MNIETILYGAIAFLLGLIPRVIESQKSWKDKKNQTWGLSEGQLWSSSWILLIGGLLMVIYGIFNE